MKKIMLHNAENAAGDAAESFEHDEPRIYEALERWRIPAIVTVGALYAGLFFLGLTTFHAMTRWVVVLALAGVAVGTGRNAGIRLAFGVMYHGVRAYPRIIAAVFGRERKLARLRAFGCFGQDTFFLRDPVMVDRALRKVDVYSRHEMLAYRPFNQRSILGCGSGASWQKYRARFKDYLSSGYREDLPAIRALTAERVQTWRERGEIDLMSEIFKIIVEIRGHILFGVRFGCFSDGPDNLADLVDEILQPPSFPFGGAGERVKLFHARITEALAACTKAGSIGLTCKQLAASGEFTEDEMLQNASVYVLAQAPATVIFWVLYRLARDQAGSALRTDRAALLRAIKEELRLHPGVPVFFPRTVRSDDVNDGTTIPAGASVLISPIYFHTSPAMWEEPERFLPERWTLPSDLPGALLHPLTNDDDDGGRPAGCPLRRDANGHVPPRFVPFGGGQHKCQGRMFAVEELVAVVETVLAMVDLEVVADRGLLDRPIAEQIQTHVYCRPIHDVRLRVVGTP